MPLIARNSEGKIVKPGDIITSFRNEQATLRSATRARSEGRSGKVYVEWVNGQQAEYYDSVFNLIVTEE